MPLFWIFPYKSVIDKRLTSRNYRYFVHSLGNFKINVFNVLPYRLILFLFIYFFIYFKSQVYLLIFTELLIINFRHYFRWKIVVSIEIPPWRGQFDRKTLHVCTHFRQMSAQHQRVVFRDKVDEIHERWSVLRLARQNEDLRSVILHVFVHVNQLVDRC